MAVVKLKKNWPGNFRRSIRESGKVVAEYEFTAGQDVEIDDSHVPGLQDDIDKGTLILVPQVAGPAPVMEPEKQPATERKYKR
jgi:hypothetical protein